MILKVLPSNAQCKLLISHNRTSIAIGKLDILARNTYHLYRNPSQRIEMAKDLHDVVSMLKDCAKELGKTPTLREFMSFGASRRDIDRHGGHNKIIELAGLEPNFNPFASHELEARPPRVLLFDIETSAIVAHVWGGYEQNVGKNQVVKDWYVLSWAAKWLDEDKIYYEDVRNKPVNAKDIDKDILKGIHDLISKADFVVGHNSDKFDIKKLNARFIRFKLKPLQHYRSVDTLKLARKYFKFTFNTLEYLAEYLGVKFKKSKHKKFPGMELWNACMGTDKQLRAEAFKEMENYNKLDVKVLQGVYDVLAPYERSLNFTSYYQKTTCSCGNQTFVKDGLYYTAKGAFQRYVCKSCGKIFKDRTNLIEKETRKEFLK